MMKILRKILPLTMLVAMLACTQDDNGNVPETEFEKDITGSWKIVDVNRNGENITQVVDVANFRINFNNDDTYTFENYVPFVVKNAGMFNLDDPKYPFNISFKSDTGEDVQVQMGYPIVDGKRNMQLTFSPGCTLNKYVYTLEKTDK